MARATKPTVVGVRFREVGRLYHFDSSAYPNLAVGDFVIVETARGRQLGQITELVPPEKANLRGLKPIKRPATARDLVMRKLWQARGNKALVRCQEHSTKLGLEGVKFIAANYNYDGSVLSILYISEEDRVNTGQLRGRLANELHTRVEMRRVGARDSAKLLGEYGACGERRCCATHLAEFCPISIKMAKVQGVSLNPSEITGMCGRLRCCLVYEYEQYIEAARQLPRMGKRVGTPHGAGKVISLNPLQGSATVLVDDVRHEVSQEDITPVEAAQTQQGRATHLPREDHEPREHRAGPEHYSEDRQRPSGKKKRRPRRHRSSKPKK